MADLFAPGPDEAESEGERLRSGDGSDVSDGEPLPTGRGSYAHDGEVLRFGRGAEGEKGDARPWGFRDLLLVTAFAVAALVISFAVCQVIYAMAAPVMGWPEFSPEVMQDNGVFLIGIQALWWGLVMAFVAALVTRRYGLTFAQAFRLEGKPDWGRYLPLGALLAFAVAVAGGLLPMPETETPFDELLSDPTNLAVLGVFAVVFAPVLEEVIFRGLLFEPFEARLGSWAAILITSVPFALMHGDQYDWRWQNLLLLSAVAAVFGILRMRTRSLWPPIVVHMGYNATLVAAAFAALGLGE